MGKLISEIFHDIKDDLALAILAIAVLLIFIPSFTYVYFAKDLNSKEGIMNRNDTGLTLLDRNDQPFFTFYQAKQKKAVPLSEIPEITRQGVIVSEDKDFYSHPGFSIKSIARSFVWNLEERELAYGGSTITQQLVKNSLLSSQRSFLRKYQEVVLATEIERLYSKDEILEMYLNSVYFGEGAFGVEEAALTYFNKSAKDLNIAESAFLAGILPSPSTLSPFNGDPSGSRTRQVLILQKLRDEGYISEEQRSQAEAQRLVFEGKQNSLNSKAAHFAFMARDELVEKYGQEAVLRSGLKVKTTLDLNWQEYAEARVKEQVEALKGQKVSNGAAVVMDPKTGEIKALVGSKDWDDDQFGKVNVATSLRPPGSSFKPLVYAAALEKGLITPATILKDQPVTYKIQGSPDYKPQNYDRRFRGPVLPRKALANSLNVPAVEVMSKVGVPGAMEFAERMGISTLGDDPNKYGISMVLGAAEVKLVELTGSYAIFANEGKKVTPTTILEVQDKTGQLTYRHQPEQEEVLNSGIAYIISSFLSDNRARQEVFGNSLTLSRPAAVKTGTTEDYRDSLTIGYTPSLVIGVWVGNNDNTAMDRVAGSLGAAPIWRSLMERFLQGSPVENFTIPTNLSKIQVCAATSSAQLEYFIKGTEPENPCNIARRSIEPTSSPGVTTTPTPNEQVIEIEVDRRRIEEVEGVKEEKDEKDNKQD